MAKKPLQPSEIRASELVCDDVRSLGRAKSDVTWIRLCVVRDRNGRLD